MMNSTMKIVRGKVENAYADVIQNLYAAGGKDTCSEYNLKSLE